MISSWRKFPDVSIPTKAKAGGSYINSFLATGDALRCGYDEALLTDQEGYIAETSVANILLSHHQRVILPFVGAALLEGITMRTAVEFLQEEGIPVHFEQIDRSLIYSCQELLMMGTAVQIAFVDSVDGRSIGNSIPSGKSEPGPLCQMLRKKFASVIAMEHPRAKEWITEFKLSI